MSRRRVWLAAVGLAALVALGLGALWWAAAFYGRGPLPEPRHIVLEKGTGVSDIARALEEEGIVSSALAFGLGHLVHGGSLKAGEYRFEAGASIEAVYDTIRRGASVVRELTVPEGLTSAQVRALVDAAPGLEGALAQSPPEGALLPETYYYSWGDTPGQMIARMARAMDEALAELWPARAVELPLETPQQALILASIVEKETGLADERARVAGVFINRLERGMPLQSDPTVVYALTRGEAPLGRTLTRADLKTESPYNTYLHPGLPPGPIANPGKAALEAVLQPLETDELYFVATGDGGHAFARTLSEHNENVRRYRQRLEGE